MDVTGSLSLNNYDEADEVLDGYLDLCGCCVVGPLPDLPIPTHLDQPVLGRSAKVARRLRQLRSCK